MRRKARLWAAFALLLFADILIGCASPTLEQSFWSTRAAFNETHAGYNRFLAFDNAQVQACYAAHLELQGDAAKTACPPFLNQAQRARGREIVGQAQTDLAVLDRAFQQGALNEMTASEVIGKVESWSYQLLLLYAAKGGR